MSVLSNIFTSGVENIVNAVGHAIDRNFTSDEEREKVKLEVTKVLGGVQTQVIEANKVEQEELTQRLHADMRSDAWLAKNIRPLTLAFLTVSIMSIAAWTIIVGEPQTEATVSVLDMWIQFFTAAALAVYGFYFGSRGLEKIATAVSSRFARGP